MTGIEDARALPGGVAGPGGRGTREAVESPTHEVTRRMAGEAVERQRGGVGEDHERPEADAERAAEPRGVNHVTPQKGQIEERGVEEVAMEVLEHEGEGGLAAVAAGAKLADRAGRRVEEIRSVVGLAVVVAGCAEEYGR